MQHADKYYTHGKIGVDNFEHDTIVDWVERLLLQDPSNGELQEASKFLEAVGAHFFNDTITSMISAITVGDLNPHFGIRPELTGPDLRRQEFGADNKTLVNANLSLADLRFTSINADLSGANLQGADLTGASFNEADLSGVNLAGANVTGASFRRATYDENTFFPDGFHPASFDMIEKGASSHLITESGVYDGSNLGESATIVTWPTPYNPEPEITVNGHGGADNIKSDTDNSKITINAGAGDDYVAIDANADKGSDTSVDGGEGYDILKIRDPFFDGTPDISRHQDGHYTVRMGEDVVNFENVEEVWVQDKKLDM
ncbi:MAG: pentapeptide repeat-containing protein [Granulosicoccus sp.]